MEREGCAMVETAVMRGRVDVQSDCSATETTLRSPAATRLAMTEPTSATVPNGTVEAPSVESKVISPTSEIGAATPGGTPQNGAKEPLDDGKRNMVQEVEEEVDEEEEMLVLMEKQKEEEDAKDAASPSKPPGNVESAPTLLRKALATGEVANNDNSGDATKPTASKEAPAAIPSESSSDTRADGEEDSPANANGGVDTVQAQRMNQLDFLLSRASEYSEFIANDIKELQHDMQQQAQKEEEKGNKKRKSKGGGRGSKKQKKSGGGAVLKAHQARDATARASGQKAIFVQPKNLSQGCVLKDYQLEGVRWLVSLFQNGVSGILADEMGLGKTIQVIALIAHLLTMRVSGPFLIVAPLATLPNWIREFGKWLPQMAAVRYHGAAPDREALMKGPLNPKNRKQSDFPFIITSYEVAIKDQTKLEKLGEFTYVIVDEGQRLKNHRCTLIRSLKKLKAQNRLLLSGTPIQNNLDELWSLLNFVNPKIFDDLEVFQSWFGFKDIGQSTHGATNEEAVLLEEKKNQTITKLHGILRPFLLRRIKMDVLKDMPPKKEVVVYSGMSKIQKTYADLIEKGVLRDQLIKQGIEMGRTLSQTNKMMNHRKNANHPFLFGEPIDPTTGIHIGTASPQLLIRASGKFALLDRMLKRLFNDKHQVLIFSQMTALLNVIEDYLRFRQWKYCRIDGSTHIDERQRQMDIYNAEKSKGKDGGRNESDDRYFVFLLSTRAGGLGINLTSADTCIIFDSDWNPHQDSQAMDRCHRIGQTRPVAVYRLLTANSVDIEMMEKQISKKKLERMTITGGEFKKPGQRKSGKAMTHDDLNILLQDDITNLKEKGGDAEDVKISAEEFNMIMDRQKLFAEGDDAVPTEGKMYDILDSAAGDMLGAMNA